MRLDIYPQKSSQKKKKTSRPFLVCSDISNPIILHQISHSFERLRHPWLENHLERQRVGVGGFCECEFVNRRCRVGLDFKRPLDERCVHENGSMRGVKMP